MYDAILLIFHGPTWGYEGETVPAIYRSRTLAEDVSADVAYLAIRLIERRVTILTGAGVSMGDPTSLPSAAKLAEELYAEFRYTFAASALSGVTAWDLLAVADAVAGADSGGLRLMQSTLARLPFQSAIPNCGHRLLALLFAEGWVAVSMTLNYDTCLERAGSQLTDMPIHVCRDPQDLQLGSGKGRLLKLHGCASSPSSMKVTTDQLDNPDEWVKTEIQQAAAANTLVIVGIGSLAPYMKLTVSKIYEYSPGSESVWIVSPSIDSTWDDLLGTTNRSTKRHCTAEVFFDDLLRACIQRHLPRLTQAAADLDQASPASAGSALPAVTFSDVVSNGIRALRDLDVEGLLLCLRWGAVSNGEPVPMATGDWGFISLLILCIAHHAFGGSIKIRKVNSEALFEVGNFVVVFAVAVPARTSVALVKVVRDRLNASRQRGPLVSTSLPVLVVSRNHIGPLPSNSAPDDILNPDDPDDLITGPTFTRVRWIDAATLTNATSLDEARRLVAEAVA